MSSDVKTKKSKRKGNQEKFAEDIVISMKSPKNKKVATPSKNKPTKKSSNSETKKMKGKRNSSLDESWEMAVEQARGKPDGGLGDSDNDDIESDMEIETAPVEKVEGKGSSKKGQFEKGKTKPLNVIAKAANKLKRLKGKPREDGDKKTIKRKGSKDEETPKKPKIEDMTKKDRKKQRKMAATNYVLSHDAKRQWENLRRMNLTPKERQETSTNLYTLIKGKCNELIYAHDTSRVIQCMMKYGAQEHKNAIFEELKGEVLHLSKSKYAKFFVRKLLKYGTKEQRQHVFKCLYGNVRKLIKHKEAAEIVECAYNDYANAIQRSALVEEFYGPSFALFKTAELRTLEQIMESNPDKKESILSNIKESLEILVEKQVLQFSIVHRVFIEYFTHCNIKQRTEMIEIVREGVIHMLHTRDGARAAMFCLWYGTVKDRKLVIKSMKTFVLKICKEEYGHMVLLSLFDVVDDTRIVQKVILDEIIKSMHEVAQDQFGRKVLLYLLVPRDPKHFHPDIVKVLVQGDSNPTSKKEVAVRRKELLEHVSKPMVQYIVQHCEELVLSNAALIFILAVLTHVTSDPTDAMLSVAKIAARPFKASSDNPGLALHIIEHPAGHMTMKRLILNDSERIKQEEKVLFSNILLDVLPKGTLKSWAACNRGCFLMVFMIELEQTEIRNRIIGELTDIHASLQRMDFKGAQLLLKKLKEL